MVSSRCGEGRPHRPAYEVRPVSGRRFVARGVHRRNIVRNVVPEAPISPPNGTPPRSRATAGSHVRSGSGGRGVPSPGLRVVERPQLGSRVRVDQPPVLLELVVELQPPPQVSF